MNRVYNFNPGPATLPLPVLEQAQQELLDYQGTGMSLLETSHRSKAYEALNREAEVRVKRLLGVGDDYRALFLQGGASLQFAMVPMNFLSAGATADYLITGSWAEKASEEAQRIGQVHLAATTKDEQYRRIPAPDEIRLSDAPSYVHLTSNNTIYGTQWPVFPRFGEVPLVADMSSDILSRPFDANQFALLYAGAQKNIGPAGVTLVVIRQSWMDQAPKTLPAILRYATHAKNDSLYHTPPVFAVYLVNLVLKDIEERGGLAAAAERNQQKAQAVYGAIDRSGGFYLPHAAADSRSLMNITFRLPSEDLEKRFIGEATSAGMVGLKGHRSVGGVRASLYNAMSQEGCNALAAFMDDFARRAG
ncbi:MAG: 3-phosphoserine/phosphohydroxythreonine transaminase [Chloroflexaceae bacterium]|nr:3-phosphoserine/phosphohydroxythreonine transaminase [Chloroflexaceae bacterium]